MKTLTIVAPEKLEWREVADPVIDTARAAIVAPLVVGRCDLDVGFVRGLAPIPPGSPIGHEVVGRVVDVGDAVVSVVPGDLVVVPAQISCGECRQCRRGYTGRCERVPFGASYGMGREGAFGGGVADFVHVPFADAMLFPLPAAANPVDWIGFADMAQDGYRAVGPQLAERPGARVLVIGGLPSVIGIYAAAIAVALGAGTVDYYDDDESRLAEAARYGATPIRRGSTEPSGLYEIIVDSSIMPQSLLDAFRFAEPEAFITSVSVHFGETAAVPLMEAYHKGVHYRTGRPNCRATMETVCRLCCDGHFKPQAITTKVFEFNDAPAAWVDPALRTVAVRSDVT